MTVGLLEKKLQGEITPPPPPLGTRVIFLHRRPPHGNDYASANVALHVFYTKKKGWSPLPQNDLQIHYRRLPRLQIPLRATITVSTSLPFYFQNLDRLFCRLTKNYVFLTKPATDAYTIDFKICLPIPIFIFLAKHTAVLFCRYTFQFLYFR